MSIALTQLIRGREERTPVLMVVIVSTVVIPSCPETKRRGFQWHFNVSSHKCSLTQRNASRNRLVTYPKANPAKHDNEYRWQIGLEYKVADVALEQKAQREAHIGSGRLTLYVRVRPILSHFELWQLEFVNTLDRIIDPANIDFRVGVAICAIRSMKIDLI